jgi:hypothetical protein
MGRLHVSDATWDPGQRRLHAWLHLCRYAPCTARHLCTQGVRYTPTSLSVWS